MPPARVDVAVIGGGPAGAAAALALCGRLPGASIAVIEARRHETDKPGEILPAAAGVLLDRLGVMPQFAAAGFVRGHAAASAWVDDALDERHSIFSAQGAGWHLDRARFDRLMLDAAGAVGATTMRGRAVRRVWRDGPGWGVALGDDETLAARVLVWATGRSWRLARALQARVCQHQALVAYTRFFETDAAKGELIVESRPEGWWYGADLPGGRRVVSCMTDPDIGRQLRLRDGSSWRRLLGQTRRLHDGGEELGAMTRAAGTTVLAPASGPGWVAVGDTLFAADPLSSRGITHALRSGILASYAVDDMLNGREKLATERFGLFAAQGLAGYRKTLAQHYDAARRWNTPFWTRRRSDGPEAFAG